MAAIYREATINRNGPFARSEVWWREGLLRHWDAGQRFDSDAVIWVGPDGRDEGYAIYFNRGIGFREGWARNEIFVRDFQALTSDAYLGLWEHLLTHDLADGIMTEAHPDDPFQQLCEDPFKVEVSTGSEGAMLRIVDIEKALAARPSVGTRAAGFTARVEDRTLNWNNATWRIETAEGRTSAERTDAEPDVEMSVNTLASLYSGHLKPEVAAATGFVRVLRPESVAEMTQVFAVTDPPYCPDFY
jgi:predicted acetyltransferase